MRIETLHWNLKDLASRNFPCELGTLVIQLNPNPA